MTPAGLAARALLLLCFVAVLYAVWCDAGGRGVIAVLLIAAAVTALISWLAP